MSEQPKSLKITRLNTVTIVGFRDSSILDAITTQRVGRELYELVDSGNHGKIVLDFEHVRFLSSQTLGVLLTLRRKADKAGVTIALAAIRPELRRVFDISSLDKLFSFHDSVPKAAESLGEG